MRIAIFSDVHANLPAFQAVVEHALRHGAEEFWSLGDLIGYGPHPVECLTLAERYVKRWVIGNHEDMRLQLENLAKPNGGLQEPIVISRETVDKTASDFCKNPGNEGISESAVRALLLNMLEIRQSPEVCSSRLLDGRPPVSFCLEGGLKVYLSHAALNLPLDQYLYAWSDSEYLLKHAMFEHLKEAPACVLYGHAHMPSIFVADDHGRRPVEFSYGRPVVLDRPYTVICVGGVGQPRDLDPRACYAIFEYDPRVLAAPRVTFYRAPFDNQPVLQRMAKEKYPNIIMEEFATASSDIIPGSALSRLKRLAQSPGG